MNDCIYLQFFVEFKRYFKTQAGSLLVKVVSSLSNQCLCTLQLQFLLFLTCTTLIESTALITTESL